MRLALTRFRPRLLDCLANYDRRAFSADLVAGITVGIVALPLAMAFAIASGVKPEAGIFTAIIGGFIIAALGGSRVQIGGPAGAYIVIIYGIVAQYGLANLLIATVLAGVILFIMGLIGLGSLVRFIPVGIVVGFTNGIAVLIALSQVKDFLGLSIASMPADFVGVLKAIYLAIHTISWPTVALSITSLAVILAWPKIGKTLSARRQLEPTASGRIAVMTRLPGTIIALVLATIAVGVFQLPVDTIGSRFGGIPQTLPAFALPAFSWDAMRQLVAPTITLALLGAIESLLCARVADNMIDDRHDPNQELMAQGIANMVTPFFGGIPATGTIARTSTNVRAGARTPIAGIIHAITLLAIILVAAPLAVHVPLATLAAILMFVAWNMGEWREFARLRQFSNNYRVVMLSTFTLTVVLDLSVAVEVGLVLASLFFIFRIASVTSVMRIEDPTVPADVAAYRVFGSLFFGAVDKLEALTTHGMSGSRAVILDVHQVINIDTTGLDALEGLRRTLGKRDIRLIIAGLNPQPESLLRRGGFMARLAADDIQPDFAAAIAHITKAHVDTA